VGRGWDQGVWGDPELPNNQLLNERFPDKPVMLTRVDGHAVLVNEKALALANITAETAVDGGKIVCYEGKPTGIILDNAIDLIKAHIPKTDQVNLKKAIHEVQQELFAYGITHVHEAGVAYDQFRLLDEMATSNELKIGVYLMLFPTVENMNFARETGYYQNKGLSVRSFKLLMDGALGSRGACLLDPYTDLPGEHGFLLVSPSEMRQHTQEALRIGYQVNSHCIGDSANRLLLKHYDTLLAKEPDHRWRIEHAQVVAPEDVVLFSKTGVIPSIQPTHAVSDFRWAHNRLGEERLKTAYAYQTLLDERQILVLGTDFPVEDINPFATIFAATSRKNMENEPSIGFMKDESLSLDNTMRGMTIWAAYGSFQENSLGSLEKGKNATFVIFDQPVRVSQKFEPNYAFMTFINGEIVYSME
jgi:predicted amidohydrolase YtcJ